MREAVSSSETIEPLYMGLFSILVRSFSKASAALGRDFEDAFDRLIRGTSKAEPELLDELGITLRLEKATTDYATAIGKNVKALTPYQRSQAVLVETQRQLNEQFGNVDAAVNPFQQLAVTFNDIVKSATQFLLPVFELFATIVNKSAYAAIAVFGALGISILKAAIPFDTINKKVDDFKKGQKAALEAAEEKVNAYTEALKRNAREMESLNKSAGKSMQKSATTLVDGGSESKILKKASLGEKLTGQDKANLTKALKSAEAQYKKHGKIKTGIFKNADIEIVRSFGSSFKRMETTSKTSTTKISLHFQKLKASVQLKAQQMKMSLSSAFMGAAKVATTAGKVMNTALRFAGIVGIVVMVIEAFMALKNNIFDVSLKVINIAERVFNAVKGAIANLIVKVLGAYSSLAEFAGLDRVKAGIDAAREGVENFGKAAALTTKEDLLNTGLGVFLYNVQETGKAAEASKEALDEFRDSMKSFSSDFAGTAKSIATAAEAGNEFQASMIRLNATSTAGIEGKLDQIRKIGDPEQRKSAFDELKQAILDQRKVFPQLAKVVSESGDSYGELEQNLRFTVSTAQEANAGISNLNEAISSTRQTIQRGGTDIYALRQAYMEVNTAADDLTVSSTKAGESIDGIARASDSLGYSVKNALNEVEVLLQRQRDIQTEISNQNIEETKNRKLSPELQKAINERLGVERLITQEKSLQLELDTLNLKLRNMTDKGATGDPQVVIDEIARKNLELSELQAKINEEKRSISDMGKLGDAVSSSFESSFISAFDGIIQGTLSVKDAFKNMATNILQALSQVIAKLIVVKLLEMAISGIGSVSAGSAKANALQMTPNNINPQFNMPTPGSVPGQRTGGIVEKVPGYATGGIAKGRQAGYPVILHGTEAVVPLPNGKSIPVEMGRGMGQSNNVVVNVNVDSNGNAQQNTQGDQGGMNLGNAIAEAVQKELQNQKRSGGILNPYGVA